MSRIEKTLAKVKKSLNNVAFSDLCHICDHFFGESRQKGTSHRIYKMPWLGDPRVNIQNTGGKAKSYQVKQVLLAIERLKNENTEK